MSESTCSIRGHAEPEVVPEDKRRGTRPLRKVVRDTREFDNTYHPGVEKADLFHRVHGKWVGREPPPDLQGPTLRDYGEACRDPKQLCHVCGWTSVHELTYEGYTSRLRITSMHDNSGTWELGPNGPWMLKDEPNIPASASSQDYVAQHFLRQENLDIPLVEMHRFGAPTDKFHFTVMARPKGRIMMEIWDTLTPAQKVDVVDDVRRCVQELRRITRPHMQKVDGSELFDPFIGCCNLRTTGCIRTGRNEEEWIENLTPAIRKALLLRLWRENGWGGNQAARDSWVKQVDEEIVQIKAKFPKCGEPYVLTHGNLSDENILISDDNDEKKFKVSAIIGWERAGFFPWWAEYLNSNFHPRADIMLDVLGPDWRDVICPERDSQEISRAEEDVQVVRDLWEEGGNMHMSEHEPDFTNMWFRPPFCACKPYAQEFRERLLLLEEDHLDTFDVSSTDSEDSNPYFRYSKHVKQFFRWFNQISNHKSKRAGLSKPAPL